MSEQQMRVCSRCKEEKLIDGFNKNKTQPKGRTYLCQQCSRQASKDWYYNNIESASAIKKKYCHKNKEKLKEYDRQYSKTIRGRYAILKGGAKRRGVAILSFDEYENWVIKQNNHCHYCGDAIELGKGMRSLTIDRLDPSVCYAPHNMVLACRRCNLIKGNWFTEHQMLQIAGLYFGGKNKELRVLAVGGL